MDRSASMDTGWILLQQHCIKKNHKISVAYSNEQLFHSWIHWSDGMALLPEFILKSRQKSQQLPTGRSYPMSFEIQKGKPSFSSTFQVPACFTSTLIPLVKVKELGGKA